MKPRLAQAVGSASTRPNAQCRDFGAAGNEAANTLRASGREASGEAVIAVGVVVVRGLRGTSSVSSPEYRRGASFMKRSARPRVRVRARERVMDEVQKARGLQTRHQTSAPSPLAPSHDQPHLASSLIVLLDAWSRAPCRALRLRLSASCLRARFLLCSLARAPLRWRLKDTLADRRSSAD